jgi:hypothetical protein
MGILIDTDDFVGKWSIATDDYTDDHLNDYINTYEKRFLVFVAQVPQTARFISIFNEFYIDDGSCVFVSEGMKKMLLGMVYFQYVRDQSLKNTVSGTVRNQAELATQQPAFNSVVQRWNQSTDTFQNIQWYICDNSTTYPEYNGQLIQHTSGI